MKINTLIKLIAMVNTVLIVSACSTFDVMQNKAVRLDGEVYYYNEAGEVELSEEQLASLEKNGAVVRIKHVAPDGALILDPEEMAVLMQDRSVFFAELDGKNPEGEVSSLVKKGSLRKNLERIAKEEGWSTVEWSPAIDFYVNKPFAVVGPDLQSVVIEAVVGYPVYVAFDEASKAIKVLDKQAEPAKTSGILDHSDAVSKVSPKT